MYLCPHCEQPGISLLARAFLGPGMPATCKVCGGEVATPWGKFLLSLSPIVIAFLVALLSPSRQLGALAIAFGIAATILLNLRWVPLIKATGSMRFWSIRAAKADLREPALSNQRLLPYLVAIVVSQTFVIDFAVLAPTGVENFAREMILGAVSVSLSAAGILYVYWRNGGASGERFLERLLVLGWVTGVRFSVYAIVTVFIFGAILAALFEDRSLGTAIGVLFAFGMPAYYLYLGRHVGSLARERTEA